MTPNETLVKLHTECNRQNRSVYRKYAHCNLTQDIAVKYARWRDKQGIEGETGFYKWKSGDLAQLEENETSETDLFEEFMKTYRHE